MVGVAVTVTLVGVAVGVISPGVGVAVGGTVGFDVGVDTTGGFVGITFFGRKVGVKVGIGVGVSCGGGDVKITLIVGFSGRGDVSAFFLVTVKEIPTAIRKTPAVKRINRDFCSIAKPRISYQPKKNKLYLVDC